MCLKFALFVFLIFPCEARSDPAQWTDELADGSLKYACAGDSVRLPWNVTLSAGQTLEDVQWFYQGGSSQMIAVLTHGTFLPLPAFSNRVAFLPSAGIVLSGVSVHDSGNYSVEVSYYVGQSFYKVKRIVILQVGENLMTTDGVLHVSENPVAVLDKSSGQWSVELQCGAFTYLGHPPFDVQWTTPSGQMLASNSYSDGHFSLLLPFPVLGGNYSCHIPMTSIITACLPDNDTMTGEATYPLDRTNARLLLLEAQQGSLQGENARLQTENERLTQADLDSAALHAELKQAQVNLTQDVEDRLDSLTRRLERAEAAACVGNHTGSQPQVSFHARHVISFNPQLGSPIIFRDAVSNHGSAYDNSTGVFTAPMDGTYFLVAAIAPHATNSHVALYLMVQNDGGERDVASSFGCGGGCGSEISVRAVVALKQKETAWTRSEGDSFLNEGTSFSGFLISPTF